MAFHSITANTAFQSPRTRLIRSPVRYVAAAPNNTDEAQKVAPWRKVIRPIENFFTDLRNVIKHERLELVQTTAARLISIALLYPLDAWKTRLQVTAVTAGPALREAGRGSWTAGITPALFAYLPQGAIAFSLFSVFQNRLSTRFSHWDTRTRTVVAACASDAVTALWLAPSELLKIRVQAGTAVSSRSALRQGYTTTGLSAQVMRDVPFRAIYLLAYDALRAKAERRVGRALDERETIAMGVSVGAFVAAITTPIDVVRTRMMAQFPGPKLYGNCLSCTWKVLRTEGVRSMYRGIVPRTVYMGASAALFTVTYDKVRDLMKEKRKAASVGTANKTTHAM